MSMLTELDEQSDAVARLLHGNEAALAALPELAAGCTHVVAAARGTSDNAARYMQYVLGARNNLSVGLTTPSLFGPLGSPPRLTGALLVAISQSGQSPDLVNVVEEAARQGRPTLAITNDVESPMAAAADVVMDMCAGPEQAVAATKSYTASLVAAALVSQALAGADTRELDGLPGLLATSDRADVAPATAGLVTAPRCVVVGRGFQFATAFEWALKLQELTYIVAQPFSAADFRHGPVAVVQEGFPVLAVATAGPTHAEMVELIDDMLARRAHVVTMTDLPDETPGSVHVAVPPVAGWLAPIVAAPTLQRFALALALGRGLDPDDPRGLTKVTRTA